MQVYDLGLMPYKQAYIFQKEAFLKVKSGILDHALIFCRHFPVITLGRKINPANILVTPEKLQDKGIELCNIERGGDATYHGPGQLTVYPIFNLNYLKKDIHFYLRYLESVIIDSLFDLGIHAERKEGLTGAWVNERKIASIGISIKNWITFHGFTINIKKDDLENFKLIRPCGMDIKMTSAESVLGMDIEIGRIRETIKRRIQNDQNSFAGVR